MYIYSAVYILRCVYTAQPPARSISTAPAAQRSAHILRSISYASRSISYASRCILITSLRSICDIMYTIHTHLTMYTCTHKRHMRVTLDLEVYDDLNIEDLDFTDLLQLEGDETVDVTILDYDNVY